MKVPHLAAFGLQVASVYAQEACDSACQSAYQASLAIERASWVSQNVTLDAFYATPANASSARPGALLRWEDIPQTVVNSNFTPPAGMSISRFLYMTEDIDRKPIPASAFVLLPYNKPDPDKPLHTLDLYYEWQGPYALAQAGYAVIAPDYAGQGSDIPQGFMYEAGFLHAADVAYGLIAARTVIGDLLSQEYVVVGHSEGGMTAWRTNERLAMPDQAALKEAGTFLGSVANSPALRPLDLIPESVRRAKGGPIGDAVSVFFLQSLALLFPTEFRLEDWVTNLVLARITLVEQGCLQAGRALFANLTSNELFKSLDWLKLPVVVDWQKRYNGAGPHALAAPMLVVAGITDPLTYAANTEWDFNQTCNSFPETKATLLLYPDTDHNVAAQNTQVDILRWIKDRFDGKAVEEGCHIRTVEPVNSRFRNVGTFYSGVGGG
ncbi:Alpha/Beta hydrolase protein [Paraphoma chrysanthemicola]|uniref:Alpha/Beta hydrolase protein n=1 Tax=Paraphoma chrysanthemicola TaxID=798071 RepID=A0A8K0R8I4_9PLEO|nr:Alpha/Beta hydrolase protein [Paraphoma chrysanthemicola]